MKYEVLHACYSPERSSDELRIKSKTTNRRKTKEKRGGEEDEEWRKRRNTMKRNIYSDRSCMWSRFARLAILTRHSLEAPPRYYWLIYIYISLLLVILVSFKEKQRGKRQTKKKKKKKESKAGRTCTTDTFSAAKMVTTKRQKNLDVNSWLGGGVIL